MVSESIKQAIKKTCVFKKARKKQFNHSTNHQPSNGRFIYKKIRNKTAKLCHDQL